MPDADLLTSLGEIAGIGGIALGVALYVLRGVVAKTLKVQSPEGHRTLRFCAGIAFAIGVAGIAAAVIPELSRSGGDASAQSGASTSGDQSPIVQGTNGSVTIDLKSNGARVGPNEPPGQRSGPTTTGDQSPIVKDTKGDVNVTIESNR